VKELVRRFDEPARQRLRDLVDAKAANAALIKEALREPRSV
jgi:hypothetical protein